jgi:hypothetical protein
MMTSIIPSDMALSPMGGRRAKIGRLGREQSTYHHPVPAQEPVFRCSRHCEERGDEAIHLIQATTQLLDCFASLAMTVSSISAAV